MQIGDHRIGATFLDQSICCLAVEGPQWFIAQEESGTCFVLGHLGRYSERTQHVLHIPLQLRRLRARRGCVAVDVRALGKLLNLETEKIANARRRQARRVRLAELLRKGMRCSRARSLLKAQGFRARKGSDGVSEWLAAGLPLQT